jgi:hypothetical protein
MYELHRDLLRALRASGSSETGKALLASLPEPTTATVAALSQSAVPSKQFADSNVSERAVTAALGDGHNSVLTDAVQLESRPSGFRLLLDHASADLRDARKETRRRVDRVFNAGLWIGILGGVLVFVGVALALAGLVAPGIV